MTEPPTASRTQSLRIRDNVQHNTVQIYIKAHQTDVVKPLTDTPQMVRQTNMSTTVVAKTMTKTTTVVAQEKKNTTTVFAQSHEQDDHSGRTERIYLQTRVLRAIRRTRQDEVPNYMGCEWDPTQTLK